MGKGTMPPSEASPLGRWHGLRVHKDCVKLDDTYCVQFNQPGFILHVPLGHFSPEITSGPFPGDGHVEGPFKAIKKGTITIVFISFENFKTYVERLKISADCETTDPPC